MNRFVATCSYFLGSYGLHGKTMIVIAWMLWLLLCAKELPVDEPLRCDVFVLSWELWLAREDNDSDCLDAVVVMVRKGGIVFGGNGAYQDDKMNGKNQSN